MTNKNDALSSAVKSLIHREYFYGIFLMMLNKKWDDSIGTAGVVPAGTQFELLIDENFFLKQTENHRVGLLKHECCHITNFHLTDFGHLGDQEIANYAMDLEINQHIGRDNLPPGGLFLDSFPKLNLEPFKGTNYYYEKLIEGANSGDPDVKALQKASEEGKSSCILPSTGMQGNVPNHTRADNKGVGETQQKLIKRRIESLIKNTAEIVNRDRGTIPGEIEDILKRINELQPAKVDWRGYVRRFVGKSSEVYTKKTQRKRSLRFPEFAGLKIKQRKHCLVAWDTSASVNDSELKDFHNEIYHIQRTGVTVTMIQADSAISYIGKFDPRKDVELKGRGGTSFQPVIDYFNKHQHVYNCLIYFTDGGAPDPDNVKGSVLWIVTENGRDNHLTGQVIKVN